MRLPRIGWVVIAAAAAPIIIKAAKPFARKVGEALERGGRKLKEQIDKLNDTEGEIVVDPEEDAPSAAEESAAPAAPAEPESSPDPEPEASQPEAAESEFSAHEGEAPRPKRTRQAKPEAAAAPKQARASKSSGAKRARQAKPQDNVG